MIPFALDSLDALQESQEAGTDVKIYDPGTERVLLTIQVSGPDSKRHKRAQERAIEEAAAHGAQTPRTRDEQYEDGTRFLARVCIGWDAKTADGQSIPFTEDAAHELMTRYKIIREQVDAAAANRARFIKRSQTAWSE